jgi:hypothetical protein
MIVYSGMMGKLAPKIWNDNFKRREKNMSTESTKTIKGRISNKHGTEEYWILSVYNSTTDLTDSNKRANPFIPLPGELIIYDPDDLHPYYRFKFGDNEEDETKRKNVVELPFVLSDNLGEPQLKYKTELLKAGNSQVKVELPLDAVITGVEVRDASGELVMVDSVVTKGSSVEVSASNVGSGDYLIKLSDLGIQAIEESGGDVGVIGYVTIYNEACIYGENMTDASGEPLPAPDAYGIISVHIDEETYQVYPEFGNQEGDYYRCSLELSYDNEDYFEKVTKITYPNATISISEPIDEDLEITILYQE